MRLRLLDLFCGVGGAGMGYRAAGFDVVGVDIAPQPNYPFEFIQSDALDFPLDDFDAIHASPPCQRWSVLNAMRDYDYPDLITGTRARLVAAGVPYVIENIPRAPLENPTRLCASAFYLPLRRHRNFETSFVLESPGCHHERERAIWPQHTSGRPWPHRQVSMTGSGGGTAKDIDMWRHASGIWWATEKKELAEAIPPAYTEYVGRRLWQEFFSGTLSHGRVST